MSKYCILSSSIRDGRSPNDEEIVGMLIGFLLAGQHTSTTTSAWMGFFLAKYKALQVCLCVGCYCQLMEYILYLRCHSGSWILQIILYG